MIEAGALLDGKYRLVAPIGEGAMGSVWRAEHVALGRLVAVKLIRPDREDPELVARFRREARIAGQVRHRHVVDITDYGTADGETPYMVMELLEGESLADRLERAPRVGTRELVEIVAGALSGLEAVHAAGIVHRDIKPQNIFLVRESDGVVAKILDFGTSRADPSARLGGSTTITKTGMVIGTPYYMSGEQVRGSRDVDLRSDLYGMGVILYEGLTGTVPFDGDTLHDLMVKIATASFIPVDRLRPDLPAPLVAVVHRAMERDRDKRFPTARELRQSLLAALESQARPAIPQTAVREALAGGPAGASAGAPVDRRKSPAFTMGELYTLLAAPRSRGGSRRAAFVALAALLGCAAGAVAFVIDGLGEPAGSAPVPVRPPFVLPAPSPSPRAAAVGVRVRLKGVVPGAIVRVDGEVTAGPDLRLPADRRTRRIEVELPGAGTWSVAHPCTSDGEYTIALPPDRTARAPGPREAASPGPSKASAHDAASAGPATVPPPAQPEPVEVPRPGTLLGDPGF